MNLQGKIVGKFKIVDYASSTPPSYNLSVEGAGSHWLSEEDFRDLKYIAERILEDIKQGREEIERVRSK